jgi:hypothetical protein
MDWTRARRETQRRLTDLRARLAAARRELTDAQVTLRRAERRFSAADGKVARAEHTLDDARATRDLARRERYAARQARDRVTLAIERLQRREHDLSGRLDRMPPLGQFHGLCPVGERPSAPGTGRPPGVGGAREGAGSPLAGPAWPVGRQGCQRAGGQGLKPGVGGLGSGVCGQGVMAMDRTVPPILTALPALFVATRIGVTVPVLVT